MRAKVIIENGETTIVLTPQNDFEEDIIEKVCNRKQTFPVTTSFNVEKPFGFEVEHRIEIIIKEIQ